VEVLRAGGRLVLLIAVLLGVVTMHALAVDTAATTAIAATVTPPHDPKPGHTDAAGTSGPAIDTASAPMTAPTTAGAATVMAASQAPQAMAADPMPMPPMPPVPGHDLMHLCLAVLAALVVLLARLVLLARERHTATTAAVVAHRPVHSTPRRPPPGHAVRQAELCVLRN
jgi:hypothetical protein